MQCKVFQLQFLERFPQQIHPAHFFTVWISQEMVGSNFKKEIQSSLARLKRLLMISIFEMKPVQFCSIDELDGIYSFRTSVDPWISADHDRSF